MELNPLPVSIMRQCRETSRCLLIEKQDTREILMVIGTIAAQMSI